LAGSSRVSSEKGWVSVGAPARTARRSWEGRDGIIGVHTCGWVDDDMDGDGDGNEESPGPQSGRGGNAAGTSTANRAAAAACRRREWAVLERRNT